MLHNMLIGNPSGNHDRIAESLPPDDQLGSNIGVLRSDR
jgi:hypothetical protein